MLTSAGQIFQFKTWSFSASQQTLLRFSVLSLCPTGLPGVNGIVKDGRDGAPGDPGEQGEAGRTGRQGHQGSPGICDTSACQGAAVHGKSSNPKNH